MQVVRGPRGGLAAARYSFDLLYWYKSTNSDAAHPHVGHVRNELGKLAGKEADMDKAESHWRAAQAVFAAIGDREAGCVLRMLTYADVC
jgi:hypothetical protein